MRPHFLLAVNWGVVLNTPRVIVDTAGNPACLGSGLVLCLTEHITVIYRVAFPLGHSCLVHLNSSLIHGRLLCLRDDD